MEAKVLLEQLERDGFVVVPQALSRQEVDSALDALRRSRELGLHDGQTVVGNMYFNRMLELEPKVFAPFVAHASVRPLLEQLLGPQCQVRSLRAHMNPGAYKQEWHTDFPGYWRKPEARYAVQPIGFNTTFYLNDNGPEIAYLRFVRGGHRFQPEGMKREANPYDTKSDFHKWCESQDCVDVYPKAGDAVIFFSHIPHRGEKVNADMERSNVVVHYQGNPMYEGCWHVSEPMGFTGTFPFVKPFDGANPIQFAASRVLSRSFFHDFKSVLRQRWRGVTEKRD